MVRLTFWAIFFRGLDISGCFSLCVDKGLILWQKSFLRELSGKFFKGGKGYGGYYLCVIPLLN